MRRVVLTLLIASPLFAIGVMGRALAPAPMPATTGVLRLHLYGKFNQAKTLELAKCPKDFLKNPQEPPANLEVLAFDISSNKTLQLPDRLYCFPKITLQDGSSRTWKNQTVAVYRARSVSLYVRDESISGEMTPSMQEQLKRAIASFWAWAKTSR